MNFASSRFEAIGASNEILATDPTSLPKAVAYAKSHLAKLSAAASRFRTDSEVSRLAATRGPVVAMISPTLAKYLAIALAAARTTDGIVDPTTGNALIASGYDVDIDEVRSRGIATVGQAASCGWRNVRFDPASRFLEMPAGTLLDLGATAKAYAADLIAADLRRDLPGGFLVNLGGDIAVAGPAPAAGWQIGVKAADDSVLQVVTTRGSALATSSTQLRRWQTSVGPRHHIIDPRTGLSAPETWAQVTCVAANAWEANAASTAAIVLGLDAPDWLANRGVAARLDGVNGDVVRTPGWPEADQGAAA